LAATTMESVVARALTQLLDAGELPGYERVRAVVAPEELPRCPELTIPVPDLQAYDALIGAGSAR
jgi:hypothetical protein